MTTKAAAWAELRALKAEAYEAIQELWGLQAQRSHLEQRIRLASERVNVKAREIDRLRRALDQPTDAEASDEGQEPVG